MSVRKLLDLSGRVALITGGSRGLGLQIAEALGEMGARVVITARKQAELDDAQRQLEAHGVEVATIACDLQNLDLAQGLPGQVLARWKRLDILINNAGVNLEGTADLEIQSASQTPIEIYRKTFETNFFGLITLTQKLLPLVKKSPAGRIVNLSSALGSSTLHSDPESFLYDFKIPAYDASKAAVNSFTVHLAYELKDTPIKVNAAHPGWVKTDMGGENAPMEIEEGAKTSVELATLSDDAPSGKFIHLGKELPW